MGGNPQSADNRWLRESMGEVTIEYIKNDCSWGGEDRAAVIRRCKERAVAQYMHLRKATE